MFIFKKTQFRWWANSSELEQLFDLHKNVRLYCILSGTMSRWFNSNIIDGRSVLHSRMSAFHGKYAHACVACACVCVCACFFAVIWSRPRRQRRRGRHTSVTTTSYSGTKRFTVCIRIRPDEICMECLIRWGIFCVAAIECRAAVVAGDVDVAMRANARTPARTHASMHTPFSGVL